jgi:hypothetical protein
MTRVQQKILGFGFRYGKMQRVMTTPTTPTTEPTWDIRQRRQIEVNIDLQRRCYQGVHYKSEMRWTEWDVLESGIPESRVEKRLEFWRGLNDYAVEHRGPSARIEFESVLCKPNLESIK